MDALRDLVDKAIEHCSPNNGAELARRLGLSRSSVSLWRQGKHIEPKHLTALIHIAQADATVALRVLQEQANSRPEREVWGSLARRLGAAAAIAVVALLPTQGNAHAATNLNGSTSYALCEVIRRALRRLAAPVSPFRPAIAG